MGQLALGLRSLLLKAAIFVVLAALLAWILGGTLWPKPVRATHNLISVGDRVYFWQLQAGDMIEGGFEWRLMTGRSIAAAEPVESLDVWSWKDVAGPQLLQDAVWIAAREDDAEGTWEMFRITEEGDVQHMAQPQSRLEVERELRRLRDGARAESPRDSAADLDSGFDPDDLVDSAADGGTASSP